MSFEQQEKRPLEILADEVFTSLFPGKDPKTEQPLNDEELRRYLDELRKREGIEKLKNALQVLESSFPKDQPPTKIIDNPPAFARTPGGLVEWATNLLGNPQECEIWDRGCLAIKRLPDGSVVKARLHSKDQFTIEHVVPEGDRSFTKDTLFFDRGVIDRDGKEITVLGYERLWGDNFGKASWLKREVEPPIPQK